MPYLEFSPLYDQYDQSLIAGPGSYAMTDENGVYHLESLDRRDGAVVSSQKVAIRTYRAEQGPQGQIQVIQPELLPKRYHERSELVFDVPPEGTDQANFELTSGAAAKN